MNPFWAWFGGNPCRPLYCAAILFVIAGIILSIINGNWLEVFRCSILGFMFALTSLVVAWAWVKNEHK